MTGHVIVRRFDRKPCGEETVREELDQHFAGRYRIYGIDKHPHRERYHVEFRGLSENELKLLDQIG